MEQPRLNDGRKLAQEFYQDLKMKSIPTSTVGKTIFELPIEVRYQIWQLCLSYEFPLRRLMRSMKDTGAVSETNVLSTCSRLHLECAPIFYSINQFTPISETGDRLTRVHEGRYQPVGFPSRYRCYIRKVLVKYYNPPPHNHPTPYVDCMTWLLKHIPLLECISIYIPGFHDLESLQNTCQIFAP